jgi:hypothetical protein
LIRRVLIIFGLDRELSDRRPEAVELPLDGLSEVLRQVEAISFHAAAKGDFLNLVALTLRAGHDPLNQLYP